MHAETLDEGRERRGARGGHRVLERGLGRRRRARRRGRRWSRPSAARRASWVAEALRPKNLADRPLEDPTSRTRRRAARGPAVARTLPDRFYVRVEQDGAAPSRSPATPIPDELPVGLADRDEFTALQIDDEDLPPIDESLRWLVDYAEAERVGMAVTVPLPLPGRPVRRLIVYGVRAALDRLAGAATPRAPDPLASLHRRRRVRARRARRPTTPIRRAPSGAGARRQVRRCSTSRPGPDGRSNARGHRRGARASIRGLLDTLPGAGDREQARAAAFNTALWTTTWGDAIEHLTPSGRANGDQRLDNPSLDAVRDHWVDHVRGRGPLPAMRLGRQPYGLLPVVATDASWRPLRGGFVENSLVPFIDQHVRWMWNDARAERVPTVMNRPLDDGAAARSSAPTRCSRGCACAPRCPRIRS